MLSENLVSLFFREKHNMRLFDGALFAFFDVAFNLLKHSKTLVSVSLHKMNKESAQQSKKSRNLVFSLQLAVVVFKFAPSVI